MVDRPTDPIACWKNESGDQNHERESGIANQHPFQPIPFYHANDPVCRELSAIAGKAWTWIGSESRKSLIDYKGSFTFRRLERKLIPAERRQTRSRFHRSRGR